MGMEPSNDMGSENPEPETKEGYHTMMDSIFAESTVENVLSKYFNVSSNETPILEEKKKKDFLKNKLQNIEVKNELKRLSESPIQLSTSQKFLNENKNAKFIGKTNKENLVFSVNGNQVKITPRGRILWF